MHSFTIFSVLAVAALGTACSSSDAPPASTSNTGIAVLADGGCPDPSAQVFDGKTSCIKKDDAVSLCKEQSLKSAPDVKTTDPTCGSGCTCELCVSEMLQCMNDPDGYCPTILKCSYDHNCTGLGCYTMANCQTVVDNAPGGATGGSVALVLQVNDCATKTNAYANRSGGLCAAGCP